MNSNWFKAFLKLNKVTYGKKLTLNGVPVIFNKGGAKLTIGDNVTIKSSFLSNLVGLYSRTIIVTRTPEAEIHIGDNVGISGATIYARKGVKIGDNTLIGGNAKILDNDFHPIDVEARIKDDKSQIKARAIEIGKNCFIGCNSIILKGTVLGDNCIVGAGAVVSGKFPDNSVIGGNPAKIISSLKPVNETV
jgi:acetyltransferase-like isoleucine patch superfamily enzyme